MFALVNLQSIPFHEKAKCIRRVNVIKEFY